MVKLQYRGKIDGWNIEKVGDKKRVTGVVSNHIFFPDGSFIKTSPVVGIDTDKGIIETTSGGLYTLGFPAMLEAPAQ